MRWGWMAAACVLAQPAAAAAQEGPGEAAERYLRSFQRMDFATAVALTEPSERERAKAAIVGVETADSSDAVLREGYGVRSLAELRAMDAASVYLRYLAVIGRDSPWDAVRRAGIDIHRLGELRRGDTAFVVFRSSVTEDGDTDTQVTTVEMRRTGGAWMARLHDQLVAGLGRLQAAFGEAADSASGPPWTAGAPPVPGETPERVAERYIVAFGANDWAAITSMANPVELDTLKAAMVRGAAGDDGGRVLQDVGVSSVAELRALSPAAVYARYMDEYVARRGPDPADRLSLRVRIFGHVRVGDTAYVVYRAYERDGTLTGVQEMRVSTGVWRPYLLNR